MTMQGYQAIRALMEALELPKELSVKSMTIQADIPGPCTVTLMVFSKVIDGDKLKPILAKYRFVMEESDTPTVKEIE